MTHDEIAKRATIRELVAAFRDAEATTRHAFALLVDAEERLNAVFTLGEASHKSIRIDASAYGYHDCFGDADTCVARMARAAWSVIVDRLELRRMLSIARYRELEKQLQDGKLPPITEEAISAFVNGYAVALPDMIAEAVAEVYEWLRPRSRRVGAGKLKTNSLFEIGPKVILTGVIERRDPRWTFRPSVNHNYHQDLVALENVLNGLDGRGNISKTFISELEAAIQGCAPSLRGETSLFRFKVFGNSNLHLEFKRLDLLARFNQIAGGRRLRPAPPCDVRSAAVG